MKKLTAALLSATMIFSVGAALPKSSYDLKTTVAASEQAKFNEKEFYIVVGTYGGYTQLRCFSLGGSGTYSAEKVVWKDAPKGLTYGDLFTAEGNVNMKIIYPAQDPVNAMAYYYELEEGTKLNKIGNCEGLMDQIKLTVKRKDYDGSAHWSIRYTDESGEKEYYYGLSTYGSSLDVSPLDYSVGEVCTFAMLNGNIIVPLPEKSDNITPLKGTQEMTLYDVRYLALIGDFLDWSHFEKYKGIDIGSGQNIWEFELPKDFVLRVYGVTGEKPSLIELSRDGEEGIDIREEDVSAYIATKEMTLDDVIELSKKGSDLDWDDFEDFRCYDSSTCIRDWQYDLGNGFSLDVGGQFNGKPDFILLYYNTAYTCDVRTEDVAGFIDDITAKYIYVKGDANFDHSLDMADVVFIMQCLANPDRYQFTEQGRINADMDGNGITLEDARIIQMILLGKK